MQYTQRSALEHMRAEALAGRLGAINGGGGCLYVLGEKHCAIGCILPADVVEQCAEFGSMNNMSSGELMDTIEGLEIPFNREQASVLQEVHDDLFSGVFREHFTPEEAIRRFVEKMDSLLSGSVTHLSSPCYLTDAYFDLN